MGINLLHTSAFAYNLAGHNDDDIIMDHTNKGKDDPRTLSTATSEVDIRTYNWSPLMLEPRPYVL